MTGGDRHALRLTLLLAALPLREALAERLLPLFCLGLGCVAGVAWFTGKLVSMEVAAFQCALAAPPLRLYTLGVAALFVIASLHKEWQCKGHELFLALPMPRHCYYLGKLSGHALLGLGLLVLAMSALYPFADARALLVWSFSLYCELLIVTALGLVAALACKGVTTAFGVTAATWCLARNLEAMRQLSRDPLLEGGPLAHPLVEGTVSAFAFLLPDLHAFSRTHWLLYSLPTGGQLLHLLGETLVCLLLLAAAGLATLARKAS